MRIGIVTFLGPYGGALQCYALQKVLRSMGHDVYVINRKWGDYKLPKHKSLLIRLKQYIYNIINKDPFVKFYEQNYRFTQLVTSDDVLYDLGTKKYFDAIIAGSDQPWNPDCIKVMGYYFYLDWVSPEVKKYAYAVSYGKAHFSALQDDIEKIKSILKSYNSISVREKSGIEITKNIFNIEAQACLDPTLLLSHKDYENIIFDKTHTHEYICEFFLDPSPQKYDLTTRIAAEEHISIINNNILKPKKRIQRLFFHQRSISQWLRNIRDAKYVITDSFHGTVFSIIFHKQFISINNKKRGSARFESLLSEIDLMYRLRNIEDLDFNSAYSILKNKIDYNEVDSILDNMRISSIAFLKKIQ